jgi:SPP1 family predicted phage head-tail adaptor
MHYQVQLYSQGQRNPTDGSTMPPSFAVTTWADVRALRGVELDKAQQIAQEVEHLITIPYQPGVTENMRIDFDGRTFEIRYIEDQDERKFFLDLYCAEIGQNAGSAT